MNQRFIVSLFLTASTIFLPIHSVKSKQKHALCYKIEPWRRLGDAITTVCKTLYFSQMHNLPIYFLDFPYFDQFLIAQHSSMLTEEIKKKFSKKVTVSLPTDIENNIKDTQPILFECHFLTQTPLMYSLIHTSPGFAQLVKDAFTPIIEVPTLAKPPSVITVGLHVRKGGGFDKPLGSKQEYSLNHEFPHGFFLTNLSPAGSHQTNWHMNWPPGIMYIEAVKQYMYKKTNYSDYIWPIKFPCDQYYIDQLKELSTMLPGKNLLVYLFTDDPEPEKIMERYSAQLKEYPRIIFSYRQKNNHHTKNVLEDLYGLIQCDCLISASSSFACAAQLLGNHQVLIFPVWAVTLRDKIVISKVGILTIDTEEDKGRKVIYRETAQKNF